jgi:hypothetical protein
MDLMDEWPRALAAALCLNLPGSEDDRRRRFLALGGALKEPAGRETCARLHGFEGWSGFMTSSAGADVAAITDWLEAVASHAVVSVPAARRAAIVAALEALPDRPAAPPAAQIMEAAR